MQALTLTIFAYLTNVTQIDNLNFLNTNATTTMIGTFQHLPALKQIDVSGLNTASLVSMDSMFLVQVHLRL